MNKTIWMALAFGLASLTGCAVKVFNSPVAISSRTSALPGQVKELGSVSAERCTYLVVFPIAFKPGDLYEDLLVKSEALGGNAVRDMRVQNSSTGIFFLFGKDCWEATGTAVQVGASK